MHQQAAQATWNPERDLWETEVLDLFSEHSDAYSETFPVSGMTRNGQLFLHPQSEPHTGEIEYSSWRGLLPTPRVSDHTGAGEHGQGGLDLRTAVDLLPTPVVTDSKDTRNATANRSNPNSRHRSGATLTDAVTLLPTPRASDPATTSSHASPGFTKPLGQVARESCADTFGQYAPAITRWEAVMGREAPVPTELTPKGKHRLSAKFVEWMMGQSDGWVTDEALGLSRVQQLRALGNGVVTQQAVYAIEWLLERADQKFGRERHDHRQVAPL